MLVLVGIGVVTISVFAGYMVAGGPVMVLIQPAEFVIIGGAAAGFILILIGTPPAVAFDDARPRAVRSRLISNTDCPIPDAARTHPAAAIVATRSRLPRRRRKKIDSARA
jgi:hypothetical protein